MKLSDVFNQLSHGELVQISLGGAQGVIDDSNYQRIMASINLGLIDLYSRFLLKEGRLTMNLLPGQSTYVLDKAYAVANRESQGVPKYILDTLAQPFENDLLRIERVYDAEGFELPLNGGGDTRDLGYLGCRTPNHKTLVVPPSVLGPVVVVYRAMHPILVKELGFFDAGEVEIELPMSHLNALLLFVASRVMNPVGMNAEFHSGNNYWAKYENACAMLENQNFRLDQSEENTRLVRNGWA